MFHIQTGTLLLESKGYTTVVLFATSKMHKNCFIVNVNKQDTLTQTNIEAHTDTHTHTQTETQAYPTLQIHNRVTPHKETQFRIVVSYESRKKHIPSKIYI